MTAPLLDGEVPTLLWPLDPSSPKVPAATRAATVASATRTAATANQNCRRRWRRRASRTTAFARSVTSSTPSVSLRCVSVASAPLTATPPGFAAVAHGAYASEAGVVGRRSCAVSGRATPPGLQDFPSRPRTAPPLSFTDDHALGTMRGRVATAGDAMSELRQQFPRSTRIILPWARDRAFRLDLRPNGMRRH